MRKRKRSGVKINKNPNPITNTYTGQRRKRIGIAEKQSGQNKMLEKRRGSSKRTS